MYFRAICTTDLLLNVTPDDVSAFAVRRVHNVMVQLREVTQAEGRDGPFNGVPTVCMSLLELEPGDKVHTLFEQLRSGTLASEKERVVYSDLTTTSEGVREDRPTGLVRERVPQALEEFSRQISSELIAATETVIRLIRWRYALKGAHKPIIGCVGTEWSLDGNEWQVLPSVLSLSGFGGWTIPLDLNEHARAAVNGLLEGGVTEPLGHELYREAREQAVQNPRSALVVGIAAAEVGFKECVADLVQPAAWLVENMPSPDLVKMLREFLPLLPARKTIGGKVLSPPKSVRDSLQKGVLLRNKIAHGPAPAPSRDTLKEVLSAVEDLLWILDYYRGFDWARDFVRPDVRREWEESQGL